ncbi:DUF3152 domain-containing protein [Actinoplanes couchii]|uniref:DUF3152 domain-containing protein n=1 Tax=Actinoplanes couchii TaxID=403638 RepID=A0ABQ3XCI2_9ACTN|nr:DUF3152 domain-containing protein [Actinoplanes couchii]MDR6323679.1 hypothetical protein [Actinoplanes couchii]GID56194.1 hypothetical protein Aco03nite_045980 [Actinoplanes couchii]
MRWQRIWLVVLAVTLVSLGVTALLVGSRTPVEPAASFVTPPPASVTPPAPAEPVESEEPVEIVATDEPEPLAEDVLKLDGKVPVKGSGEFTYSTERGEVAGKKGTLRRFKVAVEKGSGEDVAEFTAQVRATLEDERSWSGSGDLRLQMVAGSDKADFTVYLATRTTTGRMCLQGGTNVTIGGVPFTSCRTTGKAIINLDRWRKSSTPYLEAEIGLAEYRRYVINHEVGHELGHRHENCPKANGPAPVMVQQTLTLRGCKPYSWPRRNGKDLVGPRI